MSEKWKKNYHHARSTCARECVSDAIRSSSRRVQRRNSTVYGGKKKRRKVSPLIFWRSFSSHTRTRSIAMGETIFFLLEILGNEIDGRPGRQRRQRNNCDQTK